MRILIAGVGNVLRGDDGFGVEVLRRLQGLPDLSGVEFFESGIAGISLVQRLMDGYDALVILDALDRGAKPGSVFVLKPDPEAVLRMAYGLNVLPKRVWIVGCQAVGCDDLGAPLSNSVACAVPVAARRVEQIIESLTSEEVCHATT